MEAARQAELREIGTGAITRKTTAILPSMPAQPTLADIYTKRLHVATHGLPFPAGAHCIQSAIQALREGLDEETVLACLLHDIGMGLARPDHGWWGAQLIEPYVSERVAWAVRHHGPLRFYPDPEVGYEYPQMYVTLFGPDYQPPKYIEDAYHYARKHKWYMTARSVTKFDDYSFERNNSVSIDPLLDIIGRHFRQPKEGLGNDSSSTSHMWRTLIAPDNPL
jgi:hypothetical protein